MELGEILLGSFACICIGGLIGFVIVVEVSSRRQRKGIKATMPADEVK